ncbi:MAG: cysA [Nitrososphaeraceae archaeon]|nr:cysA [Nitrososphaeraceae archaeon]
MNGGRKKWLEEDRPLSKDIPEYPKGNFKAAEPDNSIRVFLNYVRDSIESSKKVLIDVRSPKEFTGEILAPPEYPTEHAQRGGHIPGALNIPWSQAVSEDGTFKSAEELKKLYESKGITSNREVITYCRIGERSSHMHKTNALSVYFIFFNIKWKRLPSLLVSKSDCLFSSAHR